MATGYHDFTAGETLTAANLEDYCEKQSVMVFASAAARNSALASVLQEGMCAFLLDVNALTVYSGAAWSTVGPVHGAWTAWTPAVVQSGSVTTTNTSSLYMRVGRMITAKFLLAVTGSGSASNVVTISLPVTAASLSDVMGFGYVLDASATFWYSGGLNAVTTTTVRIMAGSGTTGNIGMGQAGSTFTAALASGDTISGFLTYEAAADA